MTISVNRAATWVLGDPRANVAEVFKDVTDGFVNENGVWVPFYSRAINPGDPFQGGFLIGQFQYGDNIPYYLIDAGTAGDTVTQFSTAETPFSNSISASFFDGAANQASLLASNPTQYLAAVHCLNYQGGGFTDWYLPSYLESEFRFRTMKPTTEAVAQNQPTGTTNSNSIPPTTESWGLDYPPITTIPAYLAGGAQAFDSSVGAGYWTSTLEAVGVFLFGTPFVLQTPNSLFAVTDPTTSTGILARPVRKVLVSSVGQS